LTIEGGDNTVEIKSPPRYYVVFCILKYASFEEAKTKAPMPSLPT
jgi:hypothetical protein